MKLIYWINFRHFQWRGESSPRKSTSPRHRGRKSSSSQSKMVWRWEAGSQSPRRSNQIGKRDFRTRQLFTDSIQDWSNPRTEVTQPSSQTRMFVSSTILLGHQRLVWQYLLWKCKAPNCGSINLERIFLHHVSEQHQLRSNGKQPRLFENTLASRWTTT